MEYSRKAKVLAQETIHSTNVFRRDYLQRMAPYR